MGICLFLRISVVLISVCSVLNQEEDFLGLFQPNPSFPHELNEFYATIQNYKDDFKEIRNLDNTKNRQFDDNVDNYKFKREFSLDSRPGNDIYPYMYSNNEEGSRTYMTPEENIRYRRHLSQGILVNDNGKSGESNSLEEKYPERFINREQQRYARQKEPTYEIVNYQNSNEKKPIYINKEHAALMNKFVEDPKKPVMVQIVHEDEENNQVARDAQSNETSDSQLNEETEDPLLLSKLLDTNAKENAMTPVRFVDKEPIVQYQQAEQQTIIDEKPKYQTVIMNAPVKNIAKPLYKDMIKIKFKNDTRVSPEKSMYQDQDNQSSKQVDNSEQQNDVTDEGQQEAMSDNKNAPDDQTYSDMSNYWTNMEKQEIHRGIERAQGLDNDDKVKAIAMALDLKQVHEVSTEMKEKGFESIESVTLPSIKDEIEEDEDNLVEEKRSILKNDLQSFEEKNYPIFSSVILEPKNQGSMFHGEPYNEYKAAKIKGQRRYINKNNQIVYEDDPESKLIKHILGGKKQKIDKNTESPIPVIDFPSIVFSQKNMKLPKFHSSNNSFVQSDLIQKTLQEVLPIKIKSIQSGYPNTREYTNHQKRGIPPRILKSHGHSQKPNEDEESLEQEPYNEEDLEALKAKLMRYKSSRRMARHKRELTLERDNNTHQMRKLQSLEETIETKDIKRDVISVELPNLEDLDLKLNKKYTEKEEIIPPRLLRTHSHIGQNKHAIDENMQQFLKLTNHKSPNRVVRPKETPNKSKSYSSNDSEQSYDNGVSIKNPTKLRSCRNYNSMCALQSSDRNSTSVPAVKPKRNADSKKSTTTLKPLTENPALADEIDYNPAKIFFQSKHVIPPRILRTHGKPWQAKGSTKEHDMDSLLNDLSEARKLMRGADDKDMRYKKSIPKPKKGKGIKPNAHSSDTSDDTLILDENKKSVNDDDDSENYEYVDDEDQDIAIEKKEARAEGDYGDEEDSTKEKVNNVKALKKSKNKFSSPSKPSDSLEDYLNEDMNVSYKKPSKLQQHVQHNQENIKTLQGQVEFAHRRPQIFKEKIKQVTSKPTYPHPIITSKFKEPNPDYLFQLKEEEQEENPTTEVWKHFQRDVASEQEDSDFKHWPKYVVDDMNKREQIKKRSLNGKIDTNDEAVDYFIREEREGKMNATTMQPSSNHHMSTNLYGCKTVNLSIYTTVNDSTPTTTPTTTVDNMMTIIPIGDEEVDEKTLTAEDATEVDVFEDFLNGDLSSNIIKTVQDDVENKLTLKKKYKIGPVVHSFNGLCTTQKSEGKKSHQPQEIMLAKKLLDSVSKILTAYLSNFNIQTVITQPKCIDLSVNLKDFLNNLITVPKCDNPMEKTLEIEEPNTEEPNNPPLLFKIQNKEVLLEEAKQEKVNKKTAVLKQLLSKYEKLPAKCKIRAKPVKEFIIRHLKLLKNINKPTRSNEPFDQPVTFSAESVDEILTENTLMQDPVEQQLESVGLGEKREDFQPNFNLKDIMEAKSAAPAAPPVAKRETDFRIPTKRFLKLYDAVRHLRERRDSEDKIGQLYAEKPLKENTDKMSNVNFESPLVYSL